MDSWNITDSMTFTTESKAQNFMVVHSQNVPGIIDISDMIASATFADLTMLRNSNLATLEPDDIHAVSSYKNHS